jgi:hypothetical protein
VKTLGIHGHEKTQIIGNSKEMDFSLHKKSKEKWDL